VQPRQPRPKTRPTLQQARIKAEKYCAYQERSQQEVKLKLLGMGLTHSESAEILAELVMQNFVNESRFAHAFAKGKLKVKKWGSRKIAIALKNKGITDALIQEVLKSIDPDYYLSELRLSIEKKAKTIKEIDPWKKAGKLKQYLIGRGYEAELVFREVDRFLKEEN
jgi:regulatory protein